MQHDPTHHDLFDDDLSAHTFEHTDEHLHSAEIHGHEGHSTALIGSGMPGHALPGHAENQHSKLADIFQLFQLNQTSHLFRLISTHPTHHTQLHTLHDSDYPANHEHTTTHSPHSHASPLTHFQPGEASHLIIGNPTKDMEAWYYQAQPDTCAIASQGFIIESLTGEHISESMLTSEAQQHGWYVPGSGTPMYHVGDLLEAHGISTLHKEGASLADVAQELQHQQKVLVGINGEDVWYHGTSNDPLALYPGIPGQHADHVVEVIGINDSQPDRPLVIINDPGSPEGQGLEVPADLFYQAWSTSGYYMVATTEQHRTSQFNDDPQVTDFYGGYYNSDGTYHYDSDPQTGAIIRRW